jgi:hypothetical protein
MESGQFVKVVPLVLKCSIKFMRMDEHLMNYLVTKMK